jgi:hypothetical protein
MKEKDFSRRDFLRMASVAPFALVLGCSNDGSGPGDAEEAIKTLILALGPWGEDRRDQAEDFSRRFLAAQSVSEAFLAQGESVKHLASRAPFRDQPLALESLDLSDYSESERKLLTSLTTQIYGILEVHYFHVAGMPDVGVCAGREWYTRPPSEW